MKSCLIKSPLTNPVRPLRFYEIVPSLVVIIVLSHTLVDTVASQMAPLWPELQRYFALDSNGIYGVIILWTSTQTFAQVVFGYLSDRLRMNYLIWLAPGVAVLSMSLVGLTDSILLASILLTVSGTAIAGFHPEAVALCGAAMPTQRSRAVSIFVFGGFVGQTLGPLYGGWVVQHFGMRGLSLGALWGGLVAIVLAFVFSKCWGKTRNVSLPDVSFEHAGTPLPWRTLFQILVIQTLRVIGATGIPLSLAFILDAQGVGPLGIGMEQSVFLGGIGAGGLVSALIFQQQQERRLLFWLPVIGVVPMLLLVITSHWQMTFCVGASALTIGIAMPVMISYGQQAVPQAQRLVSSVTMGVSWGIGGCISAGLVSQMSHWSRPQLLFVAFAISSLLAGLLSFWLPQITTSTDGTWQRENQADVSKAL